MDILSAAANLSPWTAITLSIVVGVFGLIGTWVGYKSAIKNVDAMVEMKTTEIMAKHEEVFQKHLMERINSMGTAIAETEERYNEERKKRLSLEDEVLKLTEIVYGLVRRLSKYEQHDLPPLGRL